jgi:hypothetical protein
MLEVPARVDRALGDVHPQGNPHVHLNPANIARVAAALSERLIKLDPAEAAYYRERAENFQERWRAEALSHAKVLWVGPRDADDQADLILVGHPPAPEVLKRALAHLTGRADVGLWPVVAVGRDHAAQHRWPNPGGQDCAWVSVGAWADLCRPVFV